MTTLIQSTKARSEKAVKVTPAQVSPLDLTDEHLMQRIQSRESEALGYLHDRYASMLKALIMKVLHNEAESDDMLQEIFVEIWDRASSYSPEKGKALGWIITLSRRRAIDRLRKREAYCRAEERLAEETKRHPNDWVAHVEEDIAHAEMLITRPRPVPPYLLVVEASTWLKARNRRSMRSAGIPNRYRAPQNAAMACPSLRRQLEVKVTSPTR